MTDKTGFHEFLDFTSTPEVLKTSSTPTSIESNDFNLNELGLRASARRFLESNSVKLGSLQAKVLSWMLLGEDAYVCLLSAEDRKSLLLTTLLQLYPEKQSRFVLICSDPTLSDYQKLATDFGLPNQNFCALDSDWGSLLSKDSAIFFDLSNKDYSHLNKIKETLINKSREIGLVSFFLEKDHNDLRTLFNVFSYKNKVFHQEFNKLDYSKIDTKSFDCSASKKQKFLIDCINNSLGLTRVFLNHKSQVEDLANYLRENTQLEVWPAVFPLKSSERLKLYKLLEQNANVVLVGTDRSLSFFMNKPTLVVNYDLPVGAGEYVSRLVYSAPIDQNLKLINFLCEDHSVNLTSINRLIDSDLKIHASTPVDDSFHDPAYKPRDPKEFKKFQKRPNQRGNDRRGAKGEGGFKNSRFDKHASHDNRGQGRQNQQRYSKSNAQNRHRGRGKPGDIKGVQVFDQNGSNKSKESATKQTHNSSQKGIIQKIFSFFKK